MAVEARLAGAGVWPPAQVFITTDEQTILAGIKLPCVGIKDGPVRTRRLAGGVEEKILRVHLVAWAPQGKGAAQVTGDSTQAGVLAMTATCADLLNGDLLGIEGMIDARPVEETGSRLYLNQAGRSVQQKIITFEYVRQR